MKSPGPVQSLEYSISQSVNTAWVVDAITLCNLIARLRASFGSPASARLPPPSRRSSSLPRRPAKSGLVTAVSRQQVPPHMNLNQAWWGRDGGPRS